MLAIFRGQTPDRSAVKLWSATPGQTMLHPAYQSVYDAAMRHSDLFVGAGSAFHLYAGMHHQAHIVVTDQPTDSPDWVEQVTTIHTPEGDLTSVFTKSTRQRPGYEKEYLLKEPDDIRKLLSLPYEPYPMDLASYRQWDQRVGDRGLVMLGLDHALYGLQRLIGSENFALWKYDADELMLEAMTVFARRIQAHAKAALEAGVSNVFGWVGPELCIPPLMSPTDFDRYVFDLDKPLIDLIHDDGAYVWVHCHGNMGPVLERFMRMGVDVLNPMEPPPMGDHTLAEAFDLVGDRMGLEGNIETHDLMTASRDRLAELLHAALQAGAGRRHILCPSSGYMEVPEPSETHIANMLFYVEEGVRIADSLGGA